MSDHGSGWRVLNADLSLSENVDPTAIHDDVSGELSAIAEKASPVSGDLLLIEDSAAGNAKKYCQLGNLPAGSATDNDAIHDNVAAEITAITAKTSPVSADTLLIEDSAAGDAKKSVQIADLFVEVTRIDVTNASGADIQAGKVVYASGYSVGQSLPEIDLADADNASAMPAIGFTDAIISDGADGTVVTNGIVNGVNTAGFSVGDGLWVDTTAGEFVNVRPSVDAIQKVGEVLRVNANGIVLVIGAGRTNDVPIAPSFTDYTNAGHGHTSTATGGTLASAASPTAIHDDTAAEISAITEKASPVSGDLIIIEDSAAGNAKKRVQLGNLPGGGSGDVVGPGSALDNAVARYDSTTGKLIQGSSVLIDDTDNVSGVGNITLTGTVDGRDVATDGTKLDGIEALADVTDTANVTAAGALMDSEVDADIKTLSLPASTTISAFGATLVDDADAGTARTTLDVDQAGTVNYSHPNHTGDVTSTGDGATVIADEAVTLAKMAHVATDRFLGRTTAATGDVEALTPTQATAMLDVATDALQGLAPASGGGTSNFLRADLTWTAPAGGGDVVGPGSALDNAITRYDSTTGKLIQGSSVLIDDTDNVSGVGNITLTGTVDGRDVATDGTKLDGIEALADVTDTANVTAAGALMDSEVDADIKTLVLPASTTISAFGATLVDDADAATARATLELDEQSKSITITDPGASEDISMFFTNRAITVTEIRAVLTGSSTPSVTWTVRHGTDRNATGAEVVTSGTTTTSTTTGSDVTSFNDATIVADSHIWIETTAQSGTVTTLALTVFFTYD